MNRHLIGLITLLGLTLLPLKAQVIMERTYRLPTQVTGVTSPQLSLNGTWNFKFSPETRWTTIQVPGEATMQGFAIEHDKPFFYRKQINVPSDFEGKRVILRFDGVYSHAKLTVNGHFVREHHGGFTRWETDVTPWIRIGKKNTIELEVTDRLDEISYASGYAHHPIGGILRNVTLFALPESHLYDIRAITELDSLFRNATLYFTCGFSGDDKAEITLNLKDPYGNKIPLKQTNYNLTEGINQYAIPVENPLKWDAEHPYLYELTTIVTHQETEVCRHTQHIGFREVKVNGNRLLINGRPVKLRGACRHDIHPTWGRITTAELDSLDALLFKQANMNFVRTSHYPPSETFLEFCDRYGIYVECETAACFVDTYRQKNYKPGNSQNDPAFSNRYLGQCKEMVKSFVTHPAIILWSIGNESRYGENFKKSWDYIKKEDPSRPVIFSWPGTAKGNKVYDILSIHYPPSDGHLNQMGFIIRGFENRDMPVLFDEWAHPACYTYTTLQNDPNIREFWGKSIDLMWSRLFNTAGGLGGAIWGYIDETFSLPKPKIGAPYWKEFAHTAKPVEYEGDCVGYGEWGIVDVWRRKKPEFWATKKAYSPVRLLAENSLSYIPGQEILLTVHNRFDHTYLNEIQARYTYKGTTKAIKLSDIEPHTKGIMELPAEQWEEGEKILIEFTSSDNQLIDAYNFILGKERIDYPSLLSGKTLTISDKDGKLTVSGNGFEIPFDKATGLIVNATAGGKVLIEKGPFLNLEVNLNHLSGAEVRKQADRIIVSEKDWKLVSFDYQKQKNSVSVFVSGTYGKGYVNFHILITSKGTLSVNYRTNGFPNGYLREAGISFHLPATLQQLQWKRQGYWNYYPQEAFAGNEGNAWLYRSQQAAYGRHPVQPWQTDTHEYYYWADAGTNCQQPLTRTTKGMKENIYYYTLSDGKDNGHQISVVSQKADVACRLNKRSDEQLMLYINNHWDYPEIAWGNYCKKLEAQPYYGLIELRIK